MKNIAPESTVQNLAIITEKASPVCLTKMPFDERYIATRTDLLSVGQPMLL